MPKSQEMLAVIGCLARSFRQDPNAQAALRLAWESSDADIRKAATGAEDQ